MIVANPSLSIYSFTSYREFLHDYYKEQKRKNPSFSYQIFANKAGFKTKTFIYKVIKGKKALAKSSILKIAKAIGLKKRETDYFEAMVNFNNAKGIDEKEHYFHSLQSLSKRYEASTIRRNQFSYFNQWYNVVIRELVTILDWKEDYKILAKAVNPPITPRQAKKAVTLLLDLGMIRKLPTGKYVQADKAITTGELIKSLAAHKFQMQCMDLASESLKHHDKEIRDISTLTVGITEEGFQRLAEELKNFRRRLIDIVAGDEPADRVYHINFHIFPVSEIPKKGKVQRM